MTQKEARLSQMLEEQKKKERQLENGITENEKLSEKLSKKTEELEQIEVPDNLENIENQENNVNSLYGKYLAAVPGYKVEIRTMDLDQFQADFDAAWKAYGDAEGNGQKKTVATEYYLLKWTALGF